VLDQGGEFGLHFDARLAGGQFVVAEVAGRLGEDAAGGRGGDDESGNGLEVHDVLSVATGEFR
jgi:hypothetical protein